ncbi:MAG: tetratricopeptide repeat protein [Desulfovibrionaceae bacterium]
MHAIRLFAVLLLVVLLAGCGVKMKADMALGFKNYNEAITLYNQYLAETPNDQAAQSRVGFAYLKTGQIDMAVKHLEKAHALDQENEFSILYLGLAYMNQGEGGKAITVWRTLKATERNALVAAEVKKQITLVNMNHSKRLAKAALAREKELDTSMVKPGSVAVCYFDDATKDRTFRALQKALAAMLITDLSAISSVSVVEREKLQALLEEMRLGQTGVVDAATAPRVGKLLGAERLIVGSLAEGSIRVSGSIASTPKAEVESTFTMTAAQDRFFELEKEIVHSVVTGMHLSLTAAEKKQVDRYHTQSFDAVTLFGQGLLALDEGNWKQARDFFRKAMELDPGFILASDGYDGTPDPGAPTMAAVSAFSPAAMAEAVGESISAAEAAQDAANDAADQDNNGGGDGGGGGGGDGGC